MPEKRKHNGFVGGEFVVTPQPEEVPVVDTENTEDAAKPEPTDLNLDVESRLAAIHNPDNQ